jgi:O-antigen ligase
VAAAAAVLYGLRRTPERARPYLQFGVLLLIVVVAVVAWIQRDPIVAAFNATGSLNYRLHVWHGVWALTQSRFLQGWGWVGAWPVKAAPFSSIARDDGNPPGSSLNAYLDVWFQLGLIGLAIFLGFLGLALVRSWLLASRRRSVVFAWPTLVLVALVIGALAESSILVEFGWLTAVLCAVKASRELSWRGALESVGVRNSEAQ